MKPTEDFYNLFQFIFDYFNEKLFDNELPNCMIIITRKSNVMGYYSNERWVNKQNVLTDELAINPTFFNKYPLIEMLQTIGHEMCHLWQYHFGKASRRSYHNKEWGNKMISIGLYPSNTGKVGGKRTGQQMMEYPIINGVFIKASAELIKNPKFEKLWYDRSFNPKSIKNNSFDSTDEYQNNIIINDEIDEETNNFLYSTYEVEKPILMSSSDSSKSKYQCPTCYTNIWGKKNLNIICAECNEYFVHQ